MTTWTPAAESFFRDFLSSHFGARPADEVAHDIRCHVHEELTQRGVSEVTRTELQRVVEELHPDQGMVEAESAHANPPKEEDKQSTSSAGRYVAASIFYVLLPLIVAVGEGLYHWCAQVFFDPMPTLAHAVLLLLVPITTACLLWKQTPWTPRSFQVIACLSGISLVVSIYYLLLTFWWLPLAAVGVIFFGLGLIPMAPAFAFFGIVRSRGAFWKELPSAREIPWQRWSRRGICLGIGALLVLEVPSYVGQIGLRMAMSENLVTRDRGLNLIRIAGTETDLLRACYDPGRGPSGNRDAAGMIFGGGTRSATDAQKVYFLVTGKPYNEVEPPEMHSRLFRSDQWDDITFDIDQGGDRVGGRLRGLFMDASSMDTHVDTAACLSYTEWTVEFENLSPDTHEARCQVQLPPEGVVSRVTLWINGEPEEAAFGPNSQVKQAYKDVVLVEQRDPVLVTVSGPGTVLVQCYPVLPRKRMKIRLGITAPWSPDEPEVILPRVVERNFGFPSNLKHHVWTQGNGHSHGGQCVLTNAELLANPAISPPQTNASQDLPDQIWSKDPFASCPAEAIVVGHRTSESRPATDQVVVVLDNSIGMEPFVPMLTEQLGKLPKDKIRIVIADSNVGREGLTHWRPQHGVDSLPTVHRACRELYLEKKRGAVVWLHTAHPEVSSVGPLKQLLSHQKSLHLYDVSLTHGTNAIAEALKKVPQFRSGPVMGNGFEQRLSRFLHRLTHDTKQEQWEISRQSAETAIPTGAIEVSDQFPRYATYREGMQAWREHRSVKGDWSKKLARYQLVTPISGAVVLERQEQYEKHGLEQADEKTVPHMPTLPPVPEPSSAMLLMLGIFTMGLRRKR